MEKRRCPPVSTGEKGRRGSLSLMRTHGHLLAQARQTTRRAGENVDSQLRRPVCGGGGTGKSYNLTPGRRLTSHDGDECGSSDA
ncbi:hypothetical protein MRB53_040745 [Persea americana]|nr:hypothetical protein MRB53_040745 [Persea americana]